MPDLDLIDERETEDAIRKRMDAIRAVIAGHGPRALTEDEIHQLVAEVERLDAVASHWRTAFHAAAERVSELELNVIDKLEAENAELLGRAEAAEANDKDSMAFATRMSEMRDNVLAALGAVVLTKAERGAIAAGLNALDQDQLAAGSKKDRAALNTLLQRIP